MNKPLADKVALVAGATRGAGRGIAVELSAAGATVYVTGRMTARLRLMVSISAVTCALRTARKTVSTAALPERQTGKRRVVVALRARRGRTRTAVFNSEDEALPMIRQRVADGSIVLADEAASWDGLHAWHTAKRINHSLAFMDDGVWTNQVESFFSRLRRMVGGQHHKVSGPHLHQYAAHAAWMEDHRRLDNGSLTREALQLTLASPQKPGVDW